MADHTLFVRVGVGGEPADVRGVDPLGRSAIRLSYVIHYDIREGSTVQWFVDPSTGQLLAELWVDRANGRVECAFLVEAAGISGSLEATPRERDSTCPRGTAHLRRERRRQGTSTW